MVQQVERQRRSTFPFATILTVLALGAVSGGCSSSLSVTSTTTTVDRTSNRASEASAQLDRCKTAAEGPATVFQSEIDDCKAVFSEQYLSVDCPSGQGIVLKIDMTYFFLLPGTYSTDFGSTPPSPIDPNLCG